MAPRQPMPPPMPPQPNQNAAPAMGGAMSPNVMQQLSHAAPYLAGLLGANAPLYPDGTMPPMAPPMLDPSLMPDPSQMPPPPPDVPSPMVQDVAAYNLPPMQAQGNGFDPSVNVPPPFDAMNQNGMFNKYFQNLYNQQNPGPDQGGGPAPLPPLPWQQPQVQDFMNLGGQGGGPHGPGGNPMLARFPRLARLAGRFGGM